ncbi:di-heme oxidoreductase family protein [Acaryochloris thomasi]|uniref:di-heme oxidoreductase family protein n=1 Tax=Acaryochloris thomasi TaxID=2929456 RepID=UPI001F2179A8|nr:di-heme oxidoredictase family protein [Acaryochloris thomasi]
MSKLTKFLVLAGGVAISTFLASTFFVPSSVPPAMAGGDTTVISRSSRAYEHPAPNLSEKSNEEHFEGDLAFDAVFVTAPARVNPGLGPQFNNASCTGCHLRNGRGLPEKGQLLVRVSNPENASNLPDKDDYHAERVAPSENTPPVPGIGTQIQDQAIYGHPPEARVEISWKAEKGQYQDGTGYELRSPQATITLPNEQPLPSEVLTSLRIPPPVFGLGLLEAVPEKNILALADPKDSNNDGISGRPNQVWDMEQKKITLGRFGLKANQPNLLQQSAAAYFNDMGVTNPLFLEADGSSDIDAQTLKAAAVYAQTLAVPARTLIKDQKVKRGEQLFTKANCASCHISELRTGQHEYAELENQTIHPYTDMLLHDMGAGLADNRPDFEATGSEWRTSPLWGIGVTQTVLPYSSYLHDGRARTLEEAILWHGGEAQSAQQTFMAMAEEDRDALVRFLHSL